MFSHEGSGDHAFLIAFDALIPRDGHIQNFVLILIHDSGTTEHQLTPIAT